MILPNDINLIHKKEKRLTNCIWFLKKIIGWE